MSKKKNEVPEVPEWVPRVHEPIEGVLSEAGARLQDLAKWEMEQGRQNNSTPDDQPRSLMMPPKKQRSVYNGS